MTSVIPSLHRLTLSFPVVESKLGWGLNSFLPAYLTGDLDLVFGLQDDVDPTNKDWGESTCD